MRARLSYEQRCYIEKALNDGYSNETICKKLGISGYQLTLEKRLGGWSREHKKYSAETAQLALK